MWEAFKRDMKERFLNFETAKGMFLIPAGLAGLYTTWYYTQFIIQVGCSILFIYMSSEGLRKIFVNRIKQAAKQSAMLRERINVSIPPK